jgi:transcription antitermination factor NusG
MAKKSNKETPPKSSRSLEQDSLKLASNDCFDIDKMYKGGSNKWLVLSLSEETVIQEHYPNIEYEIRDVFGYGTNYFIPLHKVQLGVKEICLVLFDGYIFIQEPKEGFTGIDFNRIRATHVRSPLSQGGSFHYVKNRDINNFKRELKKKIKNKVPKVGDTVVPKEGVFKDLEGKVISVDRTKMRLMVRFETSSRVVDAPVPFINVEYE